MNNKISLIIIKFLEITEKKNQQLKIEELSNVAVEERNLRQRVIDNMDVELLAIDREYKLTVINEPALSLFRKFGIPIQQGIYIGEAMDPDYRDIILADWRLSMGGEVIRKLNKYRFSQDDEEQTYEVNYTPAYNSDKSEIEGVVVLFRNVSESVAAANEKDKLIEDALTQKIYLESIINGYNNIMLSIDKDYTLTAFNNYAKQYFLTLKVSLAVGMNIEALYGNRNESIGKNFQRVLEKGETFTEIEVKSENTDKMYAFEFSYGPVYSDKKEIIGAWMSAKDITDLKIREKLLQNNYEETRKIEEALKAEKAKNEQPNAKATSPMEDEKNRQIVEKNYAKFKSQIDQLSEQLTRKEAENKRLKAELERRN